MGLHGELAMNCPGCDLQMTQVMCVSHQGKPLEVDTCRACHGLWFDGRESVMLSPGSTLQIFESMYALKDGDRVPLRHDKACPRCAAGLVETFDMQRNTRFSYFRCDAHGRYITFFQFMREKALVREATAQELRSLREKVRQVNCSECGAPVAIADSASCEHCKAPIVFLAGEGIDKTLKELSVKEAKRVNPDIDPVKLATLGLQKAKLERDYAELPSGGSRRGIDLLAFGVRTILDVLLY